MAKPEKKKLQASHGDLKKIVLRGQEKWPQNAKSLFRTGGFAPLHLLPDPLPIYFFLPICQFFSPIEIISENTAYRKTYCRYHYIFVKIKHL